MIKNDFYNFSKLVNSIGSYKEIQDLIYSLNYIKNEKINTKEDRSDFGYFSRRLNSQFLGYLLIEQQKENLQKKHPQIIKYGLSNEEKKLLEKYHLLTVELDRKALQPVLKKNKNIFKIVDPYNKFKYRSNEDIQLTKKDIDFIEQNSINFNDHPAILFLLNKNVEITDYDQLLQLVLSFENEIIRNGVENAPKKIIEIIEKASNTDQILVLLSLLSLRGTLEIFNQLFFQSISSNRFIYLDEDNIINYTGPINNYVGLGYKISHQLIMGLEPGEIFLFNDITSGQKKQLCRVEFQEFRMSDDIGSISNIDARFIDGNLDPYTNLSKTIPR